MNYHDFEASLIKMNPPKEWPITLKALWYDAKGDWHKAHELVDGKRDMNSKWIHAYLHRKEGDKWNASYWYRQAGKSFPEISLEEEHRALINAIRSIF